MKIEKPMVGQSSRGYSPQVQPTGDPSPQGKSKFAGCRCLAHREDGTVCNAVISSYTILPCQFCTPCFNRYMRRGLKPPIAKGMRGNKKRGLLA